MELKMGAVSETGTAGGTSGPKIGLAGLMLFGGVERLVAGGALTSIGWLTTVVLPLLSLTVSVTV
jgi:hypothetical protein